MRLQATRLIMCHMCKEPFEIFWWPMTLLVACLANAYLQVCTTIPSRVVCFSRHSCAAHSSADNGVPQTHAVMAAPLWNCFASCAAPSWWASERKFWHMCRARYCTLPPFRRCWTLRWWPGRQSASPWPATCTTYSASSTKSASTSASAA